MRPKVLMQISMIRRETFRREAHGGYPPMSDAARRVWLVEKDGRIFGRLEDACWSDMFWVRYRVVDLTTNEADHRLLFSDEFWDPANKPMFRHQRTQMVCSCAFAAPRGPTPKSPFVIMRALHPPFEGGPLYWCFCQIRGAFWRLFDF
jgi:hypothetical protein